MPPIKPWEALKERGLKAGAPDTLLSIYVPAFILAAGVSIAAPALPLYAKSFDVDFGMASLVLIVHQLGASVSTLPTSYLIDRVGGRGMALLGPLVTGAASLLRATAHSFPELLVYRFIEGWAMQMWVLGRLEIITARGGSRRAESARRPWLSGRAVPADRVQRRGDSRSARSR
jgi:MFS family permease